MIQILLIAAIAASEGGYTIDHSSMQPSAKSYFECMMRSSARYAKKASSADEAIEAASSVCRKERERSILDAASATMKEMRSKGLSPNAATVLSGAAEGLDEVDRIIKPDLVKAVLDSK